VIEPIVRGDLVIRPWHLEDAEALSDAIEQSLDHLRPWMPWTAAEPLRIGERRALIIRWTEAQRIRGDLIFGMFAGDVVVGGCGLHHRIGPAALEIGYWVHAAHLRRGYASTGAGALTSVAFTLPEIDAVEIHHDSANKASEGVPRKLGYAMVGERLKPAETPNETGVQIVWRMHRTEWPDTA